MVPLPYNGIGPFDGSVILRVIPLSQVHPIRFETNPFTFDRMHRCRHTGWHWMVAAVWPIRFLESSCLNQCYLYLRVYCHCSRQLTN